MDFWAKQPKNEQTKKNTIHHGKWNRKLVNIYTTITLAINIHKTGTTKK